MQLRNLERVRDDDDVRDGVVLSRSISLPPPPLFELRDHQFAMQRHIQTLAKARISYMH